MLGDFHIHTNFSDGQMTVGQVVDLYGQAGFGAIAITDHLCEQKTWLGKSARILKRTLTRENFSRYIETLREEKVRAWEQYGMVLIPGFELTKNRVLNARSAHILCLGIEEYVSADGCPEELARRVRDLGGLTIAAHPVNTRRLEKQTYYLWDRRKELSSAFDAWEVASGAHLFEEVAGSGLPMIANSDMHLPHQFYSWKTVLECERNPFAILDAIRRQEIDFKFYGGERPE